MAVSGDMDVEPFVPDPFARIHIGSLARGLETALELAFPAVCLHCGGRGGNRGLWWPHLCASCGAELPRLDAEVTLAGVDVCALLLHEGVARSLIHALKYRGVTRVGVALGRHLGELLEATLEGVPPGTLVTGVPLHWRRRWRRGHDQVTALLRGLRRRIPWLRVEPLLVRVRATPSQVSLDATARRRGPAGAFRLRRSAGARIRGRVVVLVDDVATTGATLAAAAAAVRRAQPRRLIGAVAALSPHSAPDAAASAGIAEAQRSWRSGASE